MPTHDLVDFMNSVTKQIADEYQRIQKRATEDPGTAGDQGEENWAEILRGWLPHTLHVVTKGRILSEEGIASPQVDVIVLRPEYPKHLLNRKLYLAGGVLAAFECKVTLKAIHLQEFIKNSVEIKKHFPDELGSPFKELQSPIIYGLLAHSHSWKEQNSKPIENITANIKTADNQFIIHPKQMPDIICVADLASWTSFKIVFMGPKLPFWDSVLEINFGPTGSAQTMYSCHSNTMPGQGNEFTPIGALIYALTNKLAMILPELRPLAKYYGQTNIQGTSGGIPRRWPPTIYSNEIRFLVESGEKASRVPYSEWAPIFTYNNIYFSLWSMFFQAGARVPRVP